MQPEKYLKKHLDLVEKTLLCRSAVAASSGHSIHRGVLRENFIKEFVLGHIGEDLGVSSGEIFDSERLVGDKANQIDVIIYSKNLPKIRIVSEDINAFMAESVHAVIEVKSILDEKELLAAYKVAHRIRCLKNDTPLPIRCFLVAYSAVAKPATVAKWLLNAGSSKGCQMIPNALDGVFILGKGFVVAPSVALWMKDRETNVIDGIAPSGDWVFVEQESGSLYALFFALNFLRYGINIRHYFKGVLPEYKIAEAKKVKAKVSAKRRKLGR